MRTYIGKFRHAKHLCDARDAQATYFDKLSIEAYRKACKKVRTQFSNKEINMEQWNAKRYLIDVAFNQRQSTIDWTFNS